MEYIAIDQPASVQIWEVWQLGRDAIMYLPAYNMGDLSEIYRDPEGQSRWYDMTSLQTVSFHIAGLLALSC